MKRSLVTTSKRLDQPVSYRNQDTVESCSTLSQQLKFAMTDNISVSTNDLTVAMQYIRCLEYELSNYVDYQLVDAPQYEAEPSSKRLDFKL